MNSDIPLTALIDLFTQLANGAVRIEEEHRADRERVIAQGELLERLFSDQKALRARIHQLELRTETEGEPA